MPSRLLASFPKTAPVFCSAVGRGQQDASWLIKALSVHRTERDRGSIKSGGVNAEPDSPNQLGARPMSYSEADFGRYQRVDDATVPVRLEDVERVGIMGNVLNGTGKATIAGKNGG